MLNIPVKSYGHVGTVSSISEREENGRRNYFMISLYESMGPGSNSQPLDLQADMCLQPDMLQTALRGPAFKQVEEKQ